MSTLDTGSTLGGMKETMKWMTRHQAAQHLGVHERTISRYMASGRLRFKRDERTGRVWVRVPLARVEDKAQEVVIDG